METKSSNTIIVDEGLDFNPQIWEEDFGPESQQLSFELFWNLILT